MSGWSPACTCPISPCGHDSLLFGYPVSERARVAAAELRGGQLLTWKDVSACDVTFEGVRVGYGAVDNLALRERARPIEILGAHDLARRSLLNDALRHEHRDRIAGRAHTGAIAMQIGDEDDGGEHRRQDADGDRAATGGK
jgi:hypothetical protein